MTSLTVCLTADEIPELDELLKRSAPVEWTAHTRDPQALARAPRQPSGVWTGRSNGPFTSPWTSATPGISA